MNGGYFRIISYSKIFVKRAEEVTQITNVETNRPSYQGSMDSFDPLEQADQYTRDVYFNNFNLDTLLSFNENNEQDIQKIKYYIESLLKPGDFSFDVLKKLGDRASAIYLNHLLKPVSSGKGEGKGTGRIVYDLGDGRVLKFAYNKSGLYQNTMESRIANRSEYFADVYDVGPSNKWIVSEKITPFKKGEFSIITGIPEELASTTGNSAQISKMTGDIFKQMIVRYDLEDDAAQFLKDIFNIHKTFGTIVGDTINPEHWGRGADGSIKLYDYGLDKSGHSVFYDKEGYIKEDPTEEEERQLIEFMERRDKIPKEHKNLGVVELASLYNMLVKRGL